jgi:asparagine synthase (glutamine-hydrolysing)
MCGIAGFSGKGSIESLSRMIAAISYRGPDVQRTHFDNEIALAHARLSIIDLRPEGNQPMFSADRKIAIVFNGEIYNYQSLRKSLAEKYVFQSDTDTEVLIYLYSAYGIKMLKYISGMFAFAIYDYHKNELFIAKDRMGKKPLYYTQTKDSFVFASELKSVLEHESVVKELNLEAVNQYLTFDYVPSPNSIINNVHKLEPATFLIIKDNKILQKQSYWQNDFSNKLNINFQDAVSKLDELMAEAVKVRLMSDVPLGVFLSGGLDSSTIAYYASKNATNTLKTFSIAFEDKSYNESDYAQLVAQQLQTEHYTEVLTLPQTIQLMDEIFPLVDEPFADASLIPTYFLSKYTRNHVTVALGGDGSDELMGGYPTFISDRFKNLIASLPPFVINFLLKTAKTILPVSDKNISFDFKIKQFLRGFTGSKNQMHQLWLGSFLPNEKQLLFKNTVFEQLNDTSGLAIVDETFRRTKQEWSDFERISYYYYQTYLHDDIFVKVDRASMYNSLEVRAPFMDKNVVEFLNALPENFKMKGLNGKYILKNLMRNKLSSTIIDRPKKGFGIPLSNWIRKDLKQKIYEVLMHRDTLFHESVIQKIYNEHISGKENHRKLIWNLYVLKDYLIRNKLI